MSNHHRGLWGYWGETADGDELTVHATGIGGPSATIVLGELIDAGSAPRDPDRVLLEPGRRRSALGIGVVAATAAPAPAARRWPPTGRSTDGADRRRRRPGRRADQPGAAAPRRRGPRLEEPSPGHGRPRALRPADRGARPARGGARRRLRGGARRRRVGRGAARGRRARSRGAAARPDRRADRSPDAGSGDDLYFNSRLRWRLRPCEACRSRGADASTVSSSSRPAPRASGSA